MRLSGKKIKTENELFLPLLSHQDKQGFVSGDLRFLFTLGVELKLLFPEKSLGGENVGDPGWEWILRLAQGEVKWGNWESLASEAGGKDMWGLHR